MAEKQTKKRASGGKTTGKSSGGRKCTSKSSRAKANTRTPVRREVGAGVCLVLALCTTLGCLGIQGALLSLLISLFRGLIGKGLYILPFSFVMGFLILLLHDGRPVALRVTCSMLLAVTIGALVQLVGGQEGADWSASMLADLWDGGLDGSCAGVVAGLLAQTLELIISRAGAVIVLLAALALELITSLNMTVRGIITAIKNRPRIEYDEPKLEHPDPAERIVNHVATRHIEHVQQEPRSAAARRRRSLIFQWTSRRCRCRRQSPEREKRPCARMCSWRKAAARCRRRLKNRNRQIQDRTSLPSAPQEGSLMRRCRNRIWSRSSRFRRAAAVESRRTAARFDAACRAESAARGTACRTGRSGSDAAGAGFRTGAQRPYAAPVRARADFSGAGCRKQQTACTGRGKTCADSAGNP